MRSLRRAGQERRHALDEVEVEGGLGARRLAFDGVERRLVGEVLVAGRHRALLDLVVDAAHDAPRRGLALGEAHQRLGLLGEAIARRQHRQLPGEILDVPSQRIAEQHGRFIVEW